MTDQIHQTVRRYYGEAALSVLNNESCCGDTGNYGSSLYSALEREELPDAAVLASLGCGNPIMVADLHDGERVLDLGSGGGIDVLLSARRVGPTGRAFGLDMTDEMLTLAQRNAAQAGATNVEWLKGQIEAIPLPAASIDVVISNCVVNLAADKAAVFREIARVLRPGGRIGITDIVADDALTAEERAALGTYTGCIAGALSFSEFRSGLEQVGLADVSLTVSHQVADRMFSVIVKATKPVGPEAAAATELQPAGAQPAGVVPAGVAAVRSGGACCG
jgi:SAM-dependent methyltransferase